MADGQFDRNEIFQGISPPETAHLFNGNGLDIRPLKVNYEKESAIFY